MSNTSPPIEQQRFARTQTPESPRPVHVPEPAKIPVLLNQMDPSSNDLQTYGVPLDSNFEQYGDSLENPAHKTSNQEDTQSMQAFLDNAANAIANDRDGQFNPNASASASENPNINANASMQYTNYPGTTLSNSLLASNPHFDSAVLQQQAASNGTQHAPAVEQSGPSDSQKESESDDYEPTADQEQKDPEENGQTVHNTNAASGKDAADANSDLKPTPGSGLGVDYQSLLDTITQSASTAPAAENIAAPTTEASLTDTHPSSLPVFPGLPPKPPPLESQSALSASATSDHAHAQQQSLQNADDALFPQHNTANGYLYQTNQQGDTIMTQPLPTNPFEGGMTNEQAVSMHMQQQSQQNLQPRPLTPPDRVETEPADRPWSPKTQAVYDEFLENERRYVTEGIWDRFPIGSRLFVGNLPSEKVTKRDLFHRFHKHGKLAQISIKQAYGFIQFHDSQSCKAALDAEQGVELRGRKVHLEISKPQKGSKSAAQQQPQTNKSQPRRRSRSPVRRPYSDFRDEPSRRREDYRRRSPSPRGYRRDDRGGRDDRRSPIYGSSYSTPQPVYDDEASLPYPRRDPRYVPDVQVIVLEAGVDQAFLNWVEDGLKRKGLSAASTWLNQRTPLPAVVKRQIMEGVQAVVKISATNQMRSKIPLQVFDRSAGTSNVTFNEYVDLDLPVAADIVLQARQRERSVMQPPRPPFPGAFVPPSPYQQQSPNSPWTPQSGAMSQYPPHPPPPTQHYQYPPQSAQPMPQQYRSQQAYPTPSSATSQPPNLHELLANLKGGSGAPPTPQSAHSAGQPFTPYGQPPPPPPQQQQYYAQPQYQQIGPPLPQHQNGTGQQNVQNIMDQLARFQQRQ